MQSDSFNWSFCQKMQMYSFHNMIKHHSDVNYYLCAMIKSINAIFSFLLSLPVLFYRYSISPFLRPTCRHVPSCSQYMLDALKIHGPFIGCLLYTSDAAD